MQSEQINELVKALAKANEQFSNVKATAENPYFKSKYAPLDAYMSMVRPALTANGLVLVQGMEAVGPGVYKFWSRVCHQSGQWFESTVVLESTKHDPQSCGSLLTYGQRYGLKALFALASEGEDDDGNEIQTVNKVDAVQKKAKQPAPNAVLTKVQRKQLLAFAEANGVTIEGLKAACAKLGFKSTAEVTLDKLPVVEEEVLKIMSGINDDNIPFEFTKEN